MPSCFAIAATNARAVALVKDDPSNTGPIAAADLFSLQGRRRIKTLFGQVFKNDDVATYRFAQDVLQGGHRWIEDGLPK